MTFPIDADPSWQGRRIVPPLADPEPSPISTTDDVVVELVKSVAEDADVAMAARVSTGGRQDLMGIRQDGNRTAGLINYLMRDRHGSPFEHNSMTFFIQAPIFVFREFHRHRVGWSYNEESGRYKELAPTFYLPGRDRPLQQVGKPGAYQYVAGTEEQYQVMEEELMATYLQAWKSYQRMLGVGIAREVARLSLPVGVLSSMYATCNARSLMHFLGLRTQHEAAKVPSFPQKEISMVADKMEAKWATLMPLTYEAFNNNGRVAP